MMLTGLKLPVLFLNEEVADLKGAGIDFPLRDCDIREMYFYHIAGVSPYYDEADCDKEYGCIHANDTEYITPITVEKLKETIDAHLYRSLFFLKS